jgi:DNA-binding MarR family transcriptional regulator
MTRDQARDTARDILQIIPLVMRAVAAELRSAGELPAPVHFGLLSMLSQHSRSLSELASLQGVSLPTMSSSISAMEERGWVRRAVPEGDRRVVTVEVTPAGRGALDRVARAAEGHLAEVLAPLDAPSRRRLHTGLGILRKVFTPLTPSPAERKRNRR